MGTLRLLVAGGHEIERKGLCAFVREQPGWHLAAEARDGREAVERARQVKPDVAIMEIDMPSLNGLDKSRKSRCKRWFFFWLDKIPINYSRKHWRPEHAVIC
jgi:DNA-binding NarL/FixJ family response regulator